ncbi:restriction endonuclease subunit S [Corynebacterium sanguinis]|uniref:restriction endonuclease subunit S n=1 Tax=Corynebacterium sanguinis TaxID=2594913 RepID=UPI00223B0B39|nr:restriction endonuclease subunit S [Corynebacterium sanguinis]MCT1415167.1 restriction endonuclease subunit S [Corynebacterium sanguinis]
MNSANEWRMVKLEDICVIEVGKTPARKNPLYWGPGHPWLSIRDMNQGAEIYSTRETITDAAVDEANMKLRPAGSVLFSFKLSIGKVAIAKIPLFTNEAIAALTPIDEGIIDRSYLAHFLRAVGPGLQGNRAVMGTTLNKRSLGGIDIPLPPLDEQQRIAKILDHAQSLQVTSQKQLSLRPHLRESLFKKHFGDPATNPYEFPLAPLGELSKIFSDGPFGSNLKSSHYTPDGVRVIRLQNIGVGEFIDRDKAFISEEHFQSIRKHECLPGDIVVGTLGDPNLRACLVPKEIIPAINKADCVQVRVDDSRANVVWMCQLLNMPGTLRLARALVKGQTRARIAMGRLRKLKVPVPPLHLQENFAFQLETLQRQEALAKEREEKLRTLTTSLFTRAFAGQL